MKSRLDPGCYVGILTLESARIAHTVPLIRFAYCL